MTAKELVETVLRELVPDFDNKKLFEQCVWSDAYAMERAEARGAFTDEENDFLKVFVDKDGSGRLFSAEAEQHDYLEETMDLVIYLREEEITCLIADLIFGLYDLRGKKSK